MFVRFNGWFDRVTEQYTNGVTRRIKGVPLVVILLVCVGVGDIFLFEKKPTGFIPPEDEGRFICHFQMPEAGSTTRAIAVMNSVDEDGAQYARGAHTAALSGLNVVTYAIKSNAGTIYIQLKPWDERNEEVEQLPGIIAELQKRICGIKMQRSR